MVHLCEKSVRPAITYAWNIISWVILLVSLPSATSFMRCIICSSFPLHSDLKQSRRLGVPCLYAGTSSSSGNNNDDNDNPTVESLAKKLEQGIFRNVVVLVGAGMSVSAGIPDFRTPGTGLYSKLEEFRLPYPEALFELEYFRKDPGPFVTIADSIWPGREEGCPKPTIAHTFLGLLARRGLLRRIYTQNIDGLERLTGLLDEENDEAARLVECHGGFATASCLDPYCVMVNHRDAELATRCRESYRKGASLSCPTCGAPVKPDVVFFGEALPPVFLEHIHDDMEHCDLLLVLGTSLMVAPTASIPDWVGPDVPRLLVNRDLVGVFAEEESQRARGLRGHGTRNVFLQGDCDDGVRILCDLAGSDWTDQLHDLHAAVTRDAP